MINERTLLEHGIQFFQQGPFPLEIQANRLDECSSIEREREGHVTFSIPRERAFNG